MVMKTGRAVPDISCENLITGGNCSQLSPRNFIGTTCKPKGTHEARA
mgnify:CR=1 FL=1